MHPDAGRQAGWSMVELLVVACVLVIMLTSALPGLRAWTSRSGADQAQARLLSLLSFARDMAITSGLMVTVCGSDDQQRCSGRWSEGAIVFIDADRDGAFSDGDTLLRAVAGVDGTRITWRSFRNRPYLQFTPMGFTNHQSGSFTLCPGPGGMAPARQVTLSASGRARAARDTDGDGVVEDASGRPVTC